LGKAYEKFFSIKPARYTNITLAKATRNNKKLTVYELEGHPKFKSKKHQDFRFPVRCDTNNTYFVNHCVQLEKIGRVPYQTNHILPEGRGNGKIYDPRIKYINKKWIFSFSMECDKQAYKLTDKSLGIDLGLTKLAVASFGGEEIVFHNINKSKRVRTLERKKAHIHRIMSRKYRVNGNHEKTKNVLKYENLYRSIEAKLANIRNNYTHQTTHKLVSLLPYRVVMEDLKIKSMLKNRHVSKAIRDQTWGYFIRQMKYKCEDYGIKFMQVPVFYPSSKTCSRCGHVKKDFKWGESVYKCKECGLVIDRDYNAAINLERYEVPIE
jgi:putative transposase